MEFPEYMSFAGGGTYGYMYIGLYRALRTHLPMVNSKSLSEMLDQVKGFSGVSIGALFALAFCLNMSDDTYESVFAKYENVSTLMPQTDFAQMLHNYGLDSGDTLRRVIRDLLRSAGISEYITFADMKRLIKRDFVCIASNLQTQNPVRFSAATTPKMIIADAVYMSMCVPFLFTPMTYNGDYMVDGCMTCQMPRVFNDDTTLFMSFDLSEMRLRVDSIQKYCAACLTCKEVHPWYRKKKCLLLQVPTKTRTHPCDFSKDYSIQRSRCGYASTLTYLYPEFRPLLTRLLKIMYEMALDRKRQLMLACVDEEEMC